MAVHSGPAGMLATRVRRSDHLSCRRCPAAGVVLVAAIFVIAPSLQAAEGNDHDGYGMLSGKVVLVGEIPKPRLLAWKEEPSIKALLGTGDEDFYSQDLVIDPKTKGIANVFVYKKNAETIHPDLKASRVKEVALRLRRKTVGRWEWYRFDPRALIVRTDQTVICTMQGGGSQGVIPHSLRTPQQGVWIPPGNRGAAKFQFGRPEPMPILVRSLCNEGRGYWLILDHPYATVTAKDGTFRIDKLPVGEHEIRIWHERVDWLVKKRRVTIKPGENRLPTVRVTADRFERRP